MASRWAAKSARKISAKVRAFQGFYMFDPSPVPAHWRYSVQSSGRALAEYIGDVQIDGDIIGGTVRKPIPAAGIHLYWNPTTGNDSNPGTLAEPFETFVALDNYVSQTYDFSSGYTLTAECTDTGTVADRIILTGAKVGQRTIEQYAIRGPGATLVLTDPTFSVISAAPLAMADIDGFDLSGPATHVQVYEGAQINLGAVNHVGGGAGCGQAANGTLRRTAPFSIDGAYDYGFVSEVGNGVVDFAGGGNDITFAAGTSFSVAFLNIGECGYGDLGIAPAFTGTFTGLPWFIEQVGELGQSVSGRSALRAAASANGIWNTTTYTNIALTPDSVPPTYPAQRMTLVGNAGELVSTPRPEALAVFSNNGDSGIAIHGAKTGKSYLIFGTTGAGGNLIGGFYYDYPSNQIVLIANGAVISSIKVGGYQMPPNAADPGSAADGDIYYNTATNNFRGHIGGVWKTFTLT